MNTQNLQTLEYVKQLEQENKLLKARLLQNMLNENTEIVRLNFKVDTLEKVIEDLTRKNAHLILFGN